MTRKNYGKQFEARFREDFKKSFPGSFIMRLADSTSGYYGASRNPCDFICLVDGALHLVEVKCHYGNTFPLSCLRQYDLLDAYSKCDGVKAEVVIWFIDHEKVVLSPIESLRRIKEAGGKSVNARDFAGWGISEVPSKKLRTFLTSDYSGVMRNHGHDADQH